MDALEWRNWYLKKKKKSQSELITESDREPRFPNSLSGAESGLVWMMLNNGFAVQSLTFQVQMEIPRQTNTSSCFCYPGVETAWDFGELNSLLWVSECLGVSSNSVPVIILWFSMKHTPFTFQFWNVSEVFFPAVGLFFQLLILSQTPLNDGK